MTIQEPDLAVYQQIVQVRGRGRVTIPADLRRDLGVCVGDIFTIVRVGDTLVWTRKKLVVPEIAQKVARILEENGVTLEDLLADLEVQRQRCNEEKYGPKAQGVS